MILNFQTSLQTLVRLLLVGRGSLIRAYSVRHPIVWVFRNFSVCRKDLNKSLQIWVLIPHSLSKRNKERRRKKHTGSIPSCMETSAFPVFIDQCKTGTGRTSNMFGEKQNASNTYIIYIFLFFFFFGNFDDYLVIWIVKKKKKKIENT